MLCVLFIGIANAILALTHSKEAASPELQPAPAACWAYFLQYDLKNTIRLPLKVSTCL